MNFFIWINLERKKKNISKFKEQWPNIPHYVKKDIKSLYSLNQARKTMRESMGLTLNDDVDVALERFMLMYNFLSQAEKETIKLSSEEKYLRKNSKKLNTSISNIQKNTKLRNEKRIKEKEILALYSEHAIHEAMIIITLYICAATMDDDDNDHIESNSILVLRSEAVILKVIPSWYYIQKQRF